METLIRSVASELGLRCLPIHKKEARMTKTNCTLLLKLCYPFTIMHDVRFDERDGSVVECLTRDRGIAGSSLAGRTALCP